VDNTVRGERWILTALAGTQITHILDFMLLMPLGAQLMRLFELTPAEFGLLVSIYMMTAAVVGFAAALVVDRFDRRTTLVVLYSCFTATTLLTATAQSYEWLLVARATAGAFGGVLAATALAIVADTVPEGRRGAALGFVMSAFSIASIVGVPLSLWLATLFSWRAPFLFLTALCSGILIAVFHAVPPIRGHVEEVRRRASLARVAEVFSNTNHWRAFGLTMLLNFSGFAVVPFLAPYFVANVGVKETELPVTYFCGGVAALIFVRLVGRWTECHGRRRLFTIVGGASILATLVITHLPPSPLWVATLAQMLIMTAFSGRFVPAMAIITAAVIPQLRGSFMSFNAALQQLAAGIASFAASLIVITEASGALLRFGAVGWLSMLATFVAIVLAARVDSAAPGSKLAR
jgi:predicted MFS family arabinose efflux permease